jgi:toxin YoeB
MQEFLSRYLGLDAPGLLTLLASSGQSAQHNVHLSVHCYPGGLYGNPSDAIFHPEFCEDLRYWVETERRMTLRVLALVEGMPRDPFRGLGKPEPLKYLGTGVWSRRLTQEHRLV